MPALLQWRRECIDSVIAGDLTRFKELISDKSVNFLNSVVQIRGSNFIIEDLQIEEGNHIETLMWNPVHFAVYYDHLHIIRYIIEELKVNVGLTVRKHSAESEKDPTNSVSFPEDRILLLLIAVDRNHLKILEYLLNALSKFWSRKDFINLLAKLPIDQSSRL